MFCSTFSSDCAISPTRASRALWKGVVVGDVDGSCGRVDAIFLPSFLGWKGGHRKSKAGRCVFYGKVTRKIVADNNNNVGLLKII